MKRVVLIVSSLLIMAGTAQADYQKGNQSLQFHFGAAGYSDEIPINNGDDKLQDGAAGGFQYLYFFRTGPTLGIGPDITWTNVSERDYSSFFANSSSHGAAHLALYQMVAKLTYPSGRLRPYVLGGIGASRSSIMGDITTPSQSLQTFDSTRYGFAGTWGVGIDWFPREHWFLGFEFRQAMLSRLEHQPTPTGAALGIQPVRDPGSISMLMFKVGYKFGDSSVAASK